MATGVRPLPRPPGLLDGRSVSRRQVLPDHPTDAPTQNKDDAIRGARGSFTSPFTLTPLTPILASPVHTPAITTSTSSANPNPPASPFNFYQNPVGGVRRKRSKSTLNRLHVGLPEGHSGTRNRVRSATVPTIPVPSTSLGTGQLPGPPPSPCILKDIIILDGIPIAKTPSPEDDSTPQRVDFPAVSSRVSTAPKPPKPRTKPVRRSFMLGSDDEDDMSRQQQKLETIAKAKKLERHEDLRRYHALMELLKTEAKYLRDLRTLVNVCTTRRQLRTSTNSPQVYLQQLPHAVTSRSVSSYFGTSPSPSKQTPSPSPSTFNSTHTQGLPPNPPPSPINSPSTIRRSLGTIDRAEIEKELPFTRPVFTDEDIQLLCRNSSKILAFHERLVDDLKEALTPLGSKFRFDTEDEYAYVDMPKHDTLELAIQIVVSMFVDRVSPESSLFSWSRHCRHCFRFPSRNCVIPSANPLSGPVFQALQILLLNTFRGR